MKNFSKLCLFILLIYSSCSIIETDKNIENDIISEFLNDPISNDYFQAVINLQNVEKGLGKMHLLNESYRKTDFKDFDDFELFIKDNFTNHEETYQKLLRFGVISEEIKNKYPDLLYIDSEGINEITAKFKILLDTSTKKNQYYNYKILGQCEDQKASSQQTCNDAALVGAVGCGLLTPTLLGALGCGAVVYLAELVCLDDADRSYAICVQ